MNNQAPQMLFPFAPNNNIQINSFINDISKQVLALNQEVKRLERRITNIEKNLIPQKSPFNINPTPMENDLNYINSNYPSNNYMI